MTTTVFPCPKCRTAVRLRDGETTVQCTGCGASVAANAASAAALRVLPASRDVSGGGETFRQAVLVLSLLGLAGGFVTLAQMRRHRVVHEAAPEAPTPIYTAPPKVEVAPTPAGAVAWEANARAPIVAAVNSDGVDDIIGFFRVWDGVSAWVAYAGAFDGATLKPLWRTEAIDPQIVKQAGVVPLAVVVGPRVVVADTSPTLRVFTLATGEKQTTLQLTGPVAELCGVSEKPSRVWVKVIGTGDSMLDLDTGKATLAARPKGCPVPGYRDAPEKLPKHAKPELVALVARKAREIAACTDGFLNAVNAHAMCTLPETERGEDGFQPRYTLTDGASTVDLGTKVSKPFAIAHGKAGAWTHSFVTDDTKAKPEAPAVADLNLGRLYAVYERIYFDAKLAALDAKTGQALWETPIEGSLPSTEGTGRGEARALVATATRVYVVRAAGALDVFDASSGKAIGTIGKQ